MRGTRGITLIALIVTIIILLILAGITITELTGSGIFGKAKLAKQKTRYSAAKEIVNLKLMEIHVDCTEKNKEYNIIKIAEGMKEVADITVEKYYNKETSKIKEGISENLTSLEGIVVSVDEYSEYKFLIGEEGQITGVLQGKITNTTLKEEFVNIAEFENKTFGSKIPTDAGDKKSEEYYLYYKGNEYKEIAGEWVNNEKVPEHVAGKLTKEPSYMIYEATTANYQNPICTKELTMDISEYDLFCVDIELISENGGNSDRNVTLQVIDKNGKVLKYQTKYGQGVNELAVGEIKTVSMNIQNIENLKEVYFGISANGYKFKIHSIYLSNYTGSNTINSEEILKNMNLDEYIYIDYRNGNDLLGNGTKNNPYKTLEKIVEDGIIQNNKSYGVLLSKGSYNLTSDMFNLNCNEKVVFIGKCGGTILNIEQIGGNTFGTGNAQYDLDFYRMIWNNESASQNYINTQNNMNLYNVLFDIRGNHQHGFFSPRGTSNITINNCLLPFNVASFIRKDMTSGYIRLTNCYGGFTSGYATAQTSWDYSTNNITTNILIDYKYRIIDNEVNWKNIGTGQNLDGTVADLGIYGGIYSWEH